MALKIKNKLGSYKLHIGSYDITKLLPEDATNTLTIVTIKHVDNNDVMVAVNHPIHNAVNQCLFDCTDFYGIELKLALINIVATLHDAMSGLEAKSVVWPNTVVGVGSRLFKNTNKLPAAKGVVVGVDYDTEEPVNKVDAILNDNKKGSVTNELKHATKFYQQVRGTDGSSRYVYIASKDTLKLAMRIRKDGVGDKLKVSVRVEDVKGYEVNDTALNLLGVMKVKAGHASCHFQCYDKETLDRFLIFFKGCLADWSMGVINIKSIKELSI